MLEFSKVRQKICDPKTMLKKQKHRKEKATKAIYFNIVLEKIKIKNIKKIVAEKKTVNT